MLKRCSCRPECPRVFPVLSGKRKFHPLCQRRKHNERQVDGYVSKVQR